MIPRLRAAVRRLPPGAFAFVMATGIVASAFRLVGWSALSSILLVIAIVGLAGLSVALVWRLSAHRDAMVVDLAEPARTFGFFTVVAALNVVGVALYDRHSPAVTIILALISVPMWLLLSYGIPSSLILGSHGKPVSAQVNGSWFLWVVGTQSVATAAAAICQDLRWPALADAAVALWGIGVLLYLMLATLVTLRLLTTPVDPHTLGPSYWIYMGATAITVLAGSKVLALSDQLPVIAVTAGFVSGFTYVLWGFGVWWIPLLILFGVWRHGLRREPVRYESELWSIVFPLGMYAVASIHYGDQVNLPLLVGIGRVGAWIAGLVWLIVAIAMVAALRPAWRDSFRSRDAAR